MELQLHTGATEYNPDFKVWNIPFVKPGGGFWTSTWNGEGSAWTEWSESEEFNLPDGDWEGILLRVKKDAKIYTIDSYDDLEWLFRRYPHTGQLLMPTLDFVQLAEDYDGLRLTDKGQWETRLSHPLSLYGWDCESTVWFRGAFQSWGRVKFPVKRSVEY